MISMFDVQTISFCLIMILKILRRFETLDHGLYERLDVLQRDVFKVLVRARRLTARDSQVTILLSSNTALQPRDLLGQLWL